MQKVGYTWDLLSLLCSKLGCLSMADVTCNILRLLSYYYLKNYIIVKAFDNKGG
jgi:hypothetical protein